jgi:hypothetical protein
VELEFLSALAAQSGPFATVYLDASHNTPDASRRIDLEWREARRELVGMGTDEDTLTALDKAVESASPAVGPAGKVLVGGHGDVVFDRDIPAPPRRRIVRYAALPHLMPLLAQSPEPLPYVLVVADRGGADLRAYAAAGAELDLGGAGQVSGPDQWPLHKVPTGGWSALRYQHAVEVAWEHNASAVAEQVRKVAEAIKARLVVVAGDVRARGLLKDALPAQVGALVVEAEGGSRAAGTDEHAFEAEVDRLIGEKVDAEHAALFERLGDGFRNDTAVQGLEAVLGALREGMVDTAILVDDPHSDATAVIGPEPLQIGLHESALAGYGVQIERDRLDAALLRALAASGAKLEVISTEYSTDEDLATTANERRAPADDVETEAPRTPQFTDGIAAIVRRQGAGLY